MRSSGIRSLRLIYECRRRMFTAAVCTEIGKPLQIQQRKEHGLSLKDDEILIANKYSGVNFADILTCQGKYQTVIPTPFTPGNEVTGIVEEVGKNVSKIKKGDKVFSLPMGNGFCTHCVAAEKDTWKLPPSVDLKIGAALVINYGTAYLSLTRKAQVQPGETVLVTAAAGGTGLAAVDISRNVLKAGKVIAACGGPEKGDLAMSKGATHVIDYRQDNVRKKIKQITGGRGVDVVFDLVGGDMFLDLVKSLAKEGRILTIGYASGKIPNIPANLLLLNSASLMGLYWGEYRKFREDVFRQSVVDVLHHAENGNISPHVGREFPIHKVNEAFQYVIGRGSTGKVVLSMDKKDSNL